MLDSPDEILIISLSMSFGEGCNAGDPLTDSLQLDMMGDDGSDKVSVIIDCFALCLLVRVVLA